MAVDDSPLASARSGTQPTTGTSSLTPWFGSAGDPGFTGAATENTKMLLRAELLESPLDVTVFETAGFLPCLDAEDYLTDNTGIERLFCTKINLLSTTERIDTIVKRAGRALDPDRMKGMGLDIVTWAEQVRGYLWISAGEAKLRIDLVKRMRLPGSDRPDEQPTPAQWQHLRVHNMAFSYAEVRCRTVYSFPQGALPPLAKETCEFLHCMIHGKNTGIDLAHQIVKLIRHYCGTFEDDLTASVELLVQGLPDDHASWIMNTLTLTLPYGITTGMKIEDRSNGWNVNSRRVVIYWNMLDGTLPAMVIAWTDDFARVYFMANKRMLWSVSDKPLEYKPAVPGDPAGNLDRMMRPRAIIAPSTAPAMPGGPRAADTAPAGMDA